MKAYFKFDSKTMLVFRWIEVLACLDVESNSNDEISTHKMTLFPNGNIFLELELGPKTMEKVHLDNLIRQVGGTRIESPELVFEFPKGKFDPKCLSGIYGQMILIGWEKTVTLNVSTNPEEVTRLSIGMGLGAKVNPNLVTMILRLGGEQVE